MDDYGSGGLSVLLRYINIASPVSPDSDRPDWVALRAVAELGYLNGALQHTDYPLLRTAASCGYLRSTDSRAGLSHPLLFQLSELGSMSTLSSLYQRSLVEELVANVVHNAAAYPNLQRLGQAISSGRVSQTPPSQSPQLTPQSQSPLPTLVKSPVTSAPPATSDRPPLAQPVGTTSRYPALHLLNEAASHAHHTTLLSFTGEFLHSTTNPFESQQEQLAEAENYFTGELSSPAAIAPRNIALLFTKPHAFGNATQELVEATLAQHHVRVDHSGTIPTETIEEEGIIDRHYAAIANYACKFAPSTISMTPNGATAFAGAFGEPWSDAIQATRILNASQAAARYGSQLTEVWKSSRPTKLMPGLYAGRAADGHYILNGFYLANREKFTREGGFVNWYVISWEERTLHWKSFRGDLVGPTNPANAPATSLRGRIFADWRELQLGYAPNVSDNGIHASAGPLEGLAERLIWLPGHTLWSDPFGRALARHGVAPAFVQSLLKNPEVELADGRKGLIFDLLEDTQSSDAVTILFALQQRMVGADVAAVPPLELLARSNTDPALRVLEVLAPQSNVQGNEVSAVPQSSVAPAPVEKPSVASNVAVPIRPHPPRTISSPYHYGQRTCGAGLESVFRYTLQYLSSRRFAAQEGQTPQAVQQSFFGLRALHAAVISVKQSTAPDPYLQISTTTWMLSLKNVEHSYAASQLPPLRPPPQGGAERFVPRPPNTVRSLESTGYGGGTSGALTARGRLTTADRIKRRTNKLHDEIVAINQRHDARTQEHLRQSPRNRPVLPNSPRRPSEVPQPQATKRPMEKALTEDPLPALRSEKIALVLNSKKSVVKQSNAQ